MCTLHRQYNRTICELKSSLHQKVVSLKEWATTTLLKLSPSLLSPHLLSPSAITFESLKFVVDNADKPRIRMSKFRISNFKFFIVEVLVDAKTCVISYQLRPLIVCFMLTQPWPSLLSFSPRMLFFIISASCFRSEFEMQGCTNWGAVNGNCDKDTYISICKPSFNATNRRSFQELDARVKVKKIGYSYLLRGQAGTSTNLLKDQEWIK